MVHCPNCDESPEGIEGEALVDAVGDDIEVSVYFDCPSCGASLSIFTSAPEVRHDQSPHPEGSA